MPEQIRDGTGKGFLAKVADDNRLQVAAVSVNEIENSSDLGNSYYVASDFVALTTTGSFNGVFYVKYTGTLTLHLFHLRTCGTQIQEWKLIKNPTTGTLISDTNAGNKNNLNFLSSNALSADVYGASGDAKTVSNGSEIAQWVNDVGHSTAELQGAIILKEGNSIALTCKPSASGDFCVTMLVYEVDE